MVKKSGGVCVQDFLDSVLFGLGMAKGSEYDESGKLAEDRYEVYVNNDFLGYKSLKAQNEEITGIDSFLYNQGITSFTSALDGNHYNIQANGADATNIKNALNVYFQNR